MALPFDLAAHRPEQIGLIVLQSDESLEPDMRRLLPADVELLVSRVASGEDVTEASLRAMEPVLTQAAALFPGGARFAAIGYGCTSGTAMLGAERVSELVQAGAATSAVTEPVSALVAACRRLGIARIGLVSPYVEDVSRQLRTVLGAAGIEVTEFASFEEPNEARVARISAEAIFDAAVKLGQSRACEAVFLSCTNLRTLTVIDPAQAQIGKPVLSSNLVLGWHLCTLAGATLSPDAPGALHHEPPRRDESAR